MRMLASIAAVALVLVPAVSGVARAASETLVAPEQPSKVVVVRDVTTRHGVVSGVLVNGSRKLLRDVRLLIHHDWLWKDEKHPGEDSPGRVDYYTVRSDLGPGKSLDFTYRTEPPLPDRDDGHFETAVEVVGWTEIGR